MQDEPQGRRLGERTGRHYCIKCMAEVPTDVYFRNDHICDDCARQDEYPLQSTPDAKESGGRAGKK